MLFVLTFLFISPCLCEENQKLIIEIENGSSSLIELNLNDIVQITINERMPSEVGVVIEFPAKYRKPLYDITASNIGKKLKIRVGDNTVYYGLIMEPLENATLVMNHPSMEEALRSIRNLGIEVDLDTKNENVYTNDSYRSKPQNDNYGKAIQALSDGDYIAAEKFALNGIESDPNDPSYYGLLSTVYYIKKDYKVALAICLKWEESIKNKDISEFPGVYQSLGDLYTIEGDYSKAELAYKKYLTVNNSNLKIHHGLAIVYEKSKQYELSKQQYQFLANSNDQYFGKIGLEGINRLNGTD